MGVIEKLEKEIEELQKKVDELHIVYRGYDEMSDRYNYGVPDNVQELIDSSYNSYLQAKEELVQKQEELKNELKERNSIPEGFAYNKDGELYSTDALPTPPRKRR